MKILLIEVKPGNDFKSHRSLDKIRAVKDWQGAKSLVFCKGNVERDGELYYLPWYMLMFIGQDKESPALIHKVDLSKLTLDYRNLP